MADTGAERTRRSRKHAAGDHSLCIPGRCGALDAAEDALVPCGAGLGLGASGQRLYDEVNKDRDLAPTTRVMLLEASRMVDRLDQLDRQLHGGDWLRFRRREDELHVVVHIDRALAEAREQATALRGLLTDIERALAGQEVPKPEGGGVLADLTARIAARRSQAAG